MNGLSTARRLEIERLIRATRDSVQSDTARQAGLVVWPDIAQELLREIDRLKSGQMRTDIDPWDG
jgi:hypothetical protein